MEFDQKKVKRIEELEDQLRKEAPSGKVNQAAQKELNKLIEETGYVEDIELDYD